jgi:hypothetical protein
LIKVRRTSINEKERRASESAVSGARRAVKLAHVEEAGSGAGGVRFAQAPCEGRDLSLASLRLRSRLWPPGVLA